jgi:hypothetical protein
LSAAPRAGAFERQWHAGVDFGYANLFDEGASGFGGGAHLTYGLTDAFNAMLELDVTHHPSRDATVWSGVVGAAYTLDIARAVPYIGVLAGVYKLAGDPTFSTFAPGVRGVAGLDYQLERNWAIGLELSMQGIFAKNPIGAVPYATTFLTAEYIWGF